MLPSFFNQSFSPRIRSCDQTVEYTHICIYTYSIFIFFYLNILINESGVSGGFPHSSVGKESACSAEDLGLIPGVRSLGQEDPLEEEMATPSSILASEIPWTEEPGGL